ncbi:MAG: hypothetical protein CMH07_06785 [Marinovum sp.]|nr:hypothetical protein [Marinovum sp.]MBQ66608.1 hypothetical protein [Marinovum sp.]
MLRISVLALHTSVFGIFEDGGESFLTMDQKINLQPVAKPVSIESSLCKLQFTTYAKKDHLCRTNQLFA